MLFPSKSLVALAVLARATLSVSTETLGCPEGYDFFLHDFSEFEGGDYINAIEDFADITAYATPFLPRGYTPVPPGRFQYHNPWGGAARIIATTMNGCKADRDLCCPNADFGGDGLGDGGQLGSPGENSIPQGNALIIQESDKRTSDDSMYGGGILIDLLEPADILGLTFGLIDVGQAGGDEDLGTLPIPSFIFVLDGIGLPNLQLIPDFGDNAFQEVVFPASPFSQGFFLRFQGSGALSYVKGCMKTAELPEGYPGPGRKLWN